jgi:ribosomal protein S10
MYYQLPYEIILKIMLYAHPSISKKMKEELNMRVFNRKIIIDYVSCNICNREHRIPKHFRC